MAFLACRVFQEQVQDKKQIAGRVIEMDEQDLSPGEVLIAVDYSGINYKDALAVTGRGKILRSYPLNAGIDLAGTVLESSAPTVKVGERVLINGCGLGESQDGGLAQRARVPAEWVIPLPQGLSPFEAMTLGTAGFTAALCLHRMLENDQRKDKGPIVVTGATGGVGSVAVALLAAQGYEVIALSGRPEHHDYLRKLGASEVCTLTDLKLGDRPLEAARWALPDPRIDRTSRRTAGDLVPTPPPGTPGPHRADWNHGHGDGSGSDAPHAVLARPVRYPRASRLPALQQPDQLQQQLAGSHPDHHLHSAPSD